MTVKKKIKKNGELYKKDLMAFPRQNSENSKFQDKY